MSDGFGLGLLVLLLAVLFFAALGLLAAQLRRGDAFFARLAAHLDGRLRRVPPRVSLNLDGVPVRIYPLQGSLQYQARLPLPDEWALLVTRRYRGWRWLDRLHASAGLQPVELPEVAAQHYGCRARQPARLRRLLDAGGLDDLLAGGRITRLQVDRRGLRATVLLWRHRPEEEALGFATVDALNRFARRLAKQTP